MIPLGSFVPVKTLPKAFTTVMQSSEAPIFLRAASDAKVYRTSQGLLITGLVFVGVGVVEMLFGSNKIERS